MAKNTPSNLIVDWTPDAISDYDGIIEDLEKSWTEEIVQRFIYP